jgi:SH3-like domain-containing protein
MLRRRLTLTILLVLGLVSGMLPGPFSQDILPRALAQSDEGSEPQGSNAKRPLPRFVSLRNNEVNMRAGPGVRYPVDWVYLRQDLPVEVIAEFDIWRKIRDPDGAEGWVHKSMLSGRRMMMVRKNHVMLRRTADDTASAAAWLESGVLGKVLQCPKDSAFCRVEVEGYPGWLRRDEMWGVYRSDVID